jgi:hypothetical protein
VNLRSPLLQEHEEEKTKTERTKRGEENDERLLYIETTRKSGRTQGGLAETKGQKRKGAGMIEGKGGIVIKGEGKRVSRIRVRL